MTKISVILETLQTGNIRATGRIGGRTASYYDGQPEQAKDLCLRVLNDVASAHCVNGVYDLKHVNMNIEAFEAVKETLEPKAALAYESRMAWLCGWHDGDTSTADSSMIAKGRQTYGDGEAWKKWNLFRRDSLTALQIAAVMSARFSVENGGPSRVFTRWPVVRVSKSYVLVSQYGGFDI